MKLIDAVIIVALLTREQYREAYDLIINGEIKLDGDVCNDPDKVLKAGQVIEWQSDIYGARQFIVPEQPPDKIDLMTPNIPDVKVPNDDKNRTMWKNGYIYGYSKKNTVLWVFGFVPKSLQAKAYGISLGDTKQLAALADENGKVIKTQHGIKHMARGLTVPKKPHLTIPGDNSSRVMWHNGYIKGYTQKLVVWSFGFKKGSPQEKIYHVSMEGSPPLLVLAKTNGKIVLKWDSLPKIPIPEVIQRVLIGKL